MERKQRAKYLIAIYLFISSLAVILLIVAFYRPNNDVWQSTLLNLGTELLGVVFTFFFVGYLFSLDELELGDRIERLVSKLENEDKVQSSKFFRQNSLDYMTLMRNSNQVDLCGAVLAGTIDKNLSHLKDAIRQGAKIRILVMEKDPLLVNIAAARSESNDFNYYDKKLEMTFQNVRYLSEYANSTLKLSNDSFEVRLLQYPPSFSILRFENKDTGNLTVEIYSHHVGWGEPPVFSLDKKTDAQWYKYFHLQFEAMWERAKKYEIGKNTEGGKE